MTWITWSVWGVTVGGLVLGAVCIEWAVNPPVPEQPRPKWAVKDR